MSAERSKSPRRTSSPTCRPDSLLNVANLALKLHYFSPCASELPLSLNSNVNVVLLMVLPELWCDGPLGQGSLRFPVRVGGLKFVLLNGK